MIEVNGFTIQRHADGIPNRVSVIDKNGCEVLRIRDASDDLNALLDLISNDEDE